MLYDKELIIDGQPKNSPEQQVWQNMKDIKMLKSFIKPIYQTTAELTSSSTGVLISDTNAPEGTKFGWILTEDGLFFQIEDSNETSFLLKFLANFKGDDGASGSTPIITANATVDANVGTPGVTVTKTGTDENPILTFSFTNLKGETGISLIEVEVVSSLPAMGRPGVLYFVPNGGSVPNQYDEYIFSEDWEKLGTQSIDLSNYIQKSNTSGLVRNDGTIDTTQYQVKQYKHNLLITYDEQQSSGWWEGRFSLEIENNSNTPITTLSELISAMEAKNITKLRASGYIYSNRPMVIAWIYYNSSNGTINWYGLNPSTNKPDNEGQYINDIQPSKITIEDDVV